MARPTFVLVVENGSRLEALRRDLSRRYEADYQVIAVASAAAALGTLRDLADSGVEVALVFADERMAGMNAVDLLVRARDLHPGAKRVLLIERGDWSAVHPAVSAMALGKIDLAVRGQGLRASMSEYLVTEISKTASITVRTGTEVTGGGGRASLQTLTLRDRASGATEVVTVSALFVMIGAEPRTEWLEGSVERDRHGFILTGRDLYQAGRLPADWPLERPPLLLETSAPGVFAAGDVRYRSVKRVASAVGEGAIAIQLLHEYLQAQDSGPHSATPARN
jgi:thioredoxin reductase